MRVSFNITPFWLSFVIGEIGAFAIAIMRVCGRSLFAFCWTKRLGWYVDVLFFRIVCKRERELRGEE